ncbi:MAG TPA: HAD family hydrolase, partial [Acidimicrobiia bacterium]|nr:HAD family hydrolase [Acidimicrobiia bacterium]
WAYDSMHRPHDATLAAWHELERRGIPVLVATGRRVTSTRDPLAALGLAPSAVVLNGSLALDLATGELFHRHHYEPGDAAVVLAAFRAHGLDPCVYVEHPDIDAYVSDAPSTSPEHLSAMGSRACQADLDDIVVSASVLSFGVFGHDADVLAAIAADIDPARSTPMILTDSWSEGSALAVAPFGLSKWTGVLAYCARHDIDPARVLAIGDEVNDVELIASAAIGVAVSDAPPSVRAVADHEVPPASAGGWAAILDLL